MLDPQMFLLLFFFFLRSLNLACFMSKVSISVRETTRVCSRDRNENDRQI